MGAVKYVGSIFLLMCLLLPSLCKNRSRYCLEGLETNGYTEPHGDIVIEYGNSLNITCILYDDYARKIGSNASQYLYFMVDSNEIPNDMIEVINSTSIKLYIDKPPASSSAYTCKLRNNSDAVCLNTVLVGTKPQPITDFSCIGYNFENLTCSWTAPDNYVYTKYNLTYYFPGRAARNNRFTCPNLTRDHNHMSCLWTIDSNPQYRQVQSTFYFELLITNVFGNNSLAKTFSHFTHVLPSPPENLAYVNTTPNSILLYWSIPQAMQVFPPGLQHRVIYQSEYGEKSWEFGGFKSTKGLGGNVFFNLTGLKYAHALYDIRISLRSTAAADINDESMWSKNSSITVRTKSKEPGAPPRTNIGSFEVVSTGSTLNNTDVYIYWQQIPEEIKNGADFTYNITVEGNNRHVKPVEITNAYAKFKNLSIIENYKFKIWSQNSAGKSNRVSHVIVPKHSDRVGEPVSFAKIAFGDGKYELSWEHPKPGLFFNDPIKNYTIFWCTHDRDRPYQCSGYLNWVEIPSDQTTYNITVSEDKTNQFAISANTEYSSSGMVWATCTVIHNKAIGKMKNVWIHEVGSTFIEIGWKLDCSDRIGSVTGFVVYFCAIVSPSTTYCKEQERNMTFKGDSTLDRARITGLHPYETYMLAVSTVTKHSESQNSDYKYQTTLEDAPSLPFDVTVVKITNSSINLSWKQPNATNGKLSRYEINYNGFRKTVDAENTSCVLDNLSSYTLYNISVIACTVNCSEPTPIKSVLTQGGFPSKIARPAVSFQNNSYIVIEWERPSFPRGNNDVFEVNFKEKLEDATTGTNIINVTDTQYMIENCGASGKFNTFYISVRAVNVFKGVRYEGPWSDELESYCRTSPNIWIWIVIPVCFLLVLALFYMAKRMYYHCREMRNVEVKLPSGLAPVITADIGLSHWNAPKSQEQKTNDPSADEELLLVKMNIAHTLSGGDSSACSSGHESVSLSLESGTNLSNSSDSGIEQSRSVSNEDLHRTNSLRLRNVSSVRPAVSKGYVTMPTDGVTTTSWNSKASPGNYCVLGVDPTPLTSVSPTYVPVSVTPPETKIPYCLTENATHPYVMSGEIPKSINPGYISVSSQDEFRGGKIVLPDLIRLDSTSSDNEAKPFYVQVTDTSNLKLSPEVYASQPLNKSGYVTTGEKPSESLGYIPHRHFDAKTLKED